MMKKVFFLLFLFYPFFIQAQNPVLIGYWHNWNDTNAPYIALNQIDSRYTVVCVSFAVPTSASDMTMLFTPDGISQSTFISQIQALQNQGKKILLSIGGATTSISLNNTTNRNAFINSMTTILNTYGFDGIDIDIEHGNSILASGTITNPTSVDCTNLIYAINQIKANYYSSFSRNMMLTFAPETAYVQGGISAYGGIWGGYLPLLHAFRNDLSYVHVQLYNSGSVYGIDGNIYIQGTADFIIALTEALIHGFTTAGGQFQGLPADKVVVGLPACSSAAGGGFVSTVNVQNAINYLRGVGPKPGSYTLNQLAGYPNLGGMMTWSINWDKVTTCNSSAYAYAQNYEQIFGTTLSVPQIDLRNNIVLSPNPSSGQITISGIKNVEKYSISNMLGQVVQQGILSDGENISVEKLVKGIYCITLQNTILKFIKE
jgi:chitinase